MLSVLSQNEVNKATGIMPGISIHTGNPICVLNSLNILKLRDDMTALSQFYSIENDSIENGPIAIKCLIHPLSVIFKYSDNTLPSPYRLTVIRRQESSDVCHSTGFA